MKSLLHFLACVSLIATLTGCVTREQADATLAKGCEVGVNALLPQGYKITNIKESTFGDSDEGQGLRAVTIKTSTMDGWLETERTYKCIFDEEFGFMNMSHTAVIHQVDIDGKKYGKVGTEIIGSVEDFTKLTNAISDAMHQH